MTFDAAMVIEAGTDTIVQSEGFDLTTFVIITPAAQWLVDLDGDIAAISGFARSVVCVTNSGANVSVQGRNFNAWNPSANQASIVIQVINNATGALDPIPGVTGQVYVTVSRMFREVQS